MAIDPLSLAGPVQQGQGVAGQYVYWMCMPHPLEETVAERGVICESSSGIWGRLAQQAPYKEIGGRRGGARGDQGDWGATAQTANTSPTDRDAQSVGTDCSI